jgi:hypothetical protein
VGVWVVGLVFWELVVSAHGGMVGAGREIRAAALGFVLCFLGFLVVAGICAGYLTLSWTLVMMSGAVVWVGCIGLPGFWRAFAGSTLPTHHVSLTGPLFFGRLVWQTPHARSSGLFSSYVQEIQVHVAVGGSAW